MAIDANTISDKTLLPHRMRASLLPARAYGRRLGKRLLHAAERSVGYFLPYRLSGIRHEDFYRDPQEACKKENIRCDTSIRRQPGELRYGRMRAGRGSESCSAHGVLHKQFRPRLRTVAETICS